MKKVFMLLFVYLAVGVLVSCGDSNRSPSVVSGSVVKGPIRGAEIKMYYFSTHATGSTVVDVEIAAENAPVITDDAGAYEFKIDHASLKGIAGPLLVRSIGGTAGTPPVPAPTLEGVIADPESLHESQDTYSCFLSVASSVAAGLLKKQMEETGLAPIPEEALTHIATVEEELGVDLSGNPQEISQGVAMFNEWVDQILDLNSTPENYPLVNDLIDYLVANLRSASGALDDQMEDPSNPEIDVEADFGPFGDLASLLPGGPGALVMMLFTADKEFIEDDGMDYATLTARILDGYGRPVTEPTPLSVTLVSGEGIISDNFPVTEGGEATVNLTSLWPGDVHVQAGLELANGNTLSRVLTVSVGDLEEEPEDSEAPWVANAGSAGNSEVLVNFSEAVLGGIDGAENPWNYRITASLLPGSDIYQSTLSVLRAELLLPDRKTVKLTTLPQSELLYTLTVSRVTDLAGNPLEHEQPWSIKPNIVTFTGTPPSAAELVDTDGDGLYDYVELRGYVITIVLTNGEVIRRVVTSDPGNADTDGDGINDLAELEYGADPRSADTDGDTITDYVELNHLYSNPYAQDSDGDDLDDGLELNFFQTSPILADTDGDQMKDDEELLELNRNPRIADLPRPRISVGEVRLQIGETYSWTDEKGETITQNSTSSSSLVQSEDTKLSTSDTNVTSWTAGGKVELSHKWSSKPSTTLKVEGHFDYTNTDTFQTSEETARLSQETYEQSLAKGREFTATSTATREVIGAKIDALVTIENAGPIAFSITNIQLTALQQSRADKTRFLPVATLIDSNALLLMSSDVLTGSTGDPSTYSLGPFASRRGPLIFENDDVFPNLVEDLMQFPGGMIFEVANYDIVDEFGRDFNFSSQTARDRTAGVTIDYGDGTVDRYLVATSVAMDLNDYMGGGMFGEFNQVGKPKGLPLDFVLQDILGLIRNVRREKAILAGVDGIADTTAQGDDVQEIPNGTAGLSLGSVVVTAGPDRVLDTVSGGDDEEGTTGDSIIAGLDQTAESIAQGDDVQMIPPDTTGVGIGSIVISAGDNGVLDTPLLGDDEKEVATGYETSLTCDARSTNVGAVCTLNSDCEGGGTCTGPERLVRVGSRRTGDFGREWWVFYADQVPSGADFGQIVLKPGQDIWLAFVQDLDRDGLVAQEEYLNGSVDSAADVYDNSKFGESFNPSVPDSQVPDGLADSKDTDRDGLGDFAEVRVGWEVSVNGSQLLRVYPSPRRKDSDFDGLSDPLEMDLRKYCRAGDLRAFCQLEKVIQENADGIIAGANGVANTIAIGDDEQLVPPWNTNLRYGSKVIGPGENGVVDSIPEYDDQYVSTYILPPASNPTRMDTDLDEVSDYDELEGYIVGLSIIDGGSKQSDTTANGDDIQKVFVGHPVAAGGVVVLPGPNQTLETIPVIDDRVRSGHLVVTDPLSRDTDSDALWEGLELTLGSDPTDPADGTDFQDTDLDGLTDAVEESLGWMVYINGNPTGKLVLSNKYNPDSDFDGLPDLVECAIKSDPKKVDTDGDGLSDYDEYADFDSYEIYELLFSGFSLDGSGSKKYGTDYRNSDTDGDTLTDSFELLTGWQVYLQGSNPRKVFSDPLLIDTDGDGMSDDDERTLKTDPMDVDTDRDQRLDGREFQVSTNPLVPDLLVTVTYTYIWTHPLSEGEDSEAAWSLYVNQPNGEIRKSLTHHQEIAMGYTGYCMIDTNSYHMHELATLSNVYNHFSFAIKEGEVFSLTGMVAELDDECISCWTGWTSDGRYCPGYYDLQELPCWTFINGANPGEKCGEGSCLLRFQKVYSFNSLSSGELYETFKMTGGTLEDPNCQADVGVMIKVE